MSTKTSSIRRRKDKEINPAMRIRDFYSFSFQILNEINFAREHPDEFLEKLKELKETVEDSKDNCLYIDNVPFVYNNLIGSLNDAIKFLEKQRDLPRLKYNKTITQACDYLLDELVAHDGLDDETANNYSLENRLNKFGHPLGESYELIDYGMFDPEFIVINFVLGDGDRNKFERKVIFNPNVKHIGIASGILSSEKICTIINCCEEFYDLYEKIPDNVQRKYNRLTPSFNTKTINNYSGKSGNSTNVERYTSNTKKEGNVEEQFTEEINTKRGDSGDVFSVKKTEFIKRRESFKDPNKNKDKNRDARIPLRKKKTKNEPRFMMDFFDDDEDFDEDDFFDKEFDINFGPHFGDKNNKTSSKKTTTTTTTTDENGVKKTVVTTVTEEIDDKGRKKREYFEEHPDEDDEENRKKNRRNKTQERNERENEEELKRERERERQDNIKYKKKIEEIPVNLKPKMGDNKEEYEEETKKTYKTVEEYPSRKKGYFQREEQEIEDEYPTDYNYRSKKNPRFNFTDDMFEKEEDIDLPEGAVSMQVQQKTITDSKGVPALIIKKTITYEDGSVKTIIEKKALDKK